ncbi:hypothetical protein M406DRAFT_294036 [Cryphonectria parasitica EP155]|uniref:Nab2-like CCCH zinc finger domain-containing protein n=1 Tax=Cryphonectria parasitica (strain ATCC 38755 / EP155) TaxID=660469 RepID=A0A9P4XXG8_CRYP1|nr:uncharacterized protein M406DRAFT_294036 [Cryphonectria parasitica EP155]KAF3762360.1 hypothetical protein M406DRAFT_294036 [Cryphonectria parasitica EP155]
MTVVIELNTPLADALNAAIQPKLEECGWATGGADDAALTEYIILMLVNGKTQDEVAQELSADLLGLDPNDAGLRDFCNWLFTTIDTLSAQYGVSTVQGGSGATAEGAQADPAAADGDQDMDMTPTDGPAELNAPTGPKAMRNGTDTRGRGKRIMGQINRAMDRTHESVLHRVRGASGTERINTHSRTPPTGPRMGAGRQPRGANSRTASIQHGLANMNNMPSPGMNGAGMGTMQAWGGMMPGHQQAPDVMSVLQQQQHLLNQMQQQMQQQLMAQSGQPNGGFNNGRGGRGRSLMERTQRGGNSRGRGGHHQNGNHAQSAEQKDAAAGPQGEDAEMGGTTAREPANPEDSICRFNLRCTNKDCKFAHQSPAAPPGATVDVKDVCSFGAACKNFKCVARHPSPAARTAHQSEQDCKFWPNCQNARCPFKHPSKPPCRNGGDCKTPGCEFYHTTVMCKYKPCTNRYCTFKHEEGQRGAFPDKVWTAEGGAGQHVSERKFADGNVVEEEVIPGAGDDAMGGTDHQTTVAG